MLPPIITAHAALNARCHDEPAPPACVRLASVNSPHASHQATQTSQPLHPPLPQVAEWLLEEALAHQSRTLHPGTPGDNITVVVVRLRPLPPLPRSTGSRLCLLRGASGDLSLTSPKLTEVGRGWPYNNPCFSLVRHIVAWMTAGKGQRAAAASRPALGCCCSVDIGRPGRGCPCSGWHRCRHPLALQLVQRAWRQCSAD
jgi:hypothetical protein